MKELPCSEIYKLEGCLKALADHHNMVSVNFPGTYPKRPYSETLQSFETDVKSGKSKIMVIESENEILGFCKIDVCEGQGKIDYLIVLKEFRGKGYGDMLMNWAMDQFKQRGVDQIEIKVADGNNAIKFYEKYGFKMNAHILRMM
ncbi:GNAT family N-acetyltransferase [Butyrivibrio sp. VCD2006]|uniref:GNAT family N-acetyltransferase n=1 Tax=Butyrivibrio sp. VCD2006 TaxID=1280664 RepID=UPI0003F6EFA4|nr:GNAT family N-acetyltransferase [Butyrivibrio sp. VCD2006]